MFVTLLADSRIRVAFLAELQAARKVQALLLGKIKVEPISASVTTIYA